jgi:hypothetical protein
MPSTSPIPGAPGHALTAAIGNVAAARDLVVGSQPADASLATRVVGHLSSAAAAVNAMADTIEQGALKGARLLADSLRGDADSIGALAHSVTFTFPSGTAAPRTRIGSDLDGIASDLKLALRQVAANGVRRLTFDEKLYGHKTQADTAWEDAAHARLVYDGS